MLCHVMLSGMRAYLTWGIGYGKKVIAQKNAQMDANIDKIKIKKLPKLEIPVCEIVSNKRALKHLRGEFAGIVLQNCAKGEVAASLILGVTKGKIVIGHGKAGGLVKAEKFAEAEVNKVIREQNLKLEATYFRMSARAPSQKDKFGCTIVALILEQ